MQRVFVLDKNKKPLMRRKKEVVAQALGENLRLIERMRAFLGAHRYCFVKDIWDDIAKMRPEPEEEDGPTLESLAGSDPGATDGEGDHWRDDGDGEHGWEQLRDELEELKAEQALQRMDIGNLKTGIREIGDIRKEQNGLKGGQLTQSRDIEKLKVEFNSRAPRREFDDMDDDEIDLSAGPDEF